MGGWIVLVTGAIFGMICGIWILAGLLLPRPPGGLTVYLGSDGVTAGRRHLWLREMGLTRDRMLVVEPPPDQARWLTERNIEVCSRESLIRRLEMGDTDGTGTGNSAGQHQRCGISEL